MIRLSIRRPVAVSMAYFGVALLGIAAWNNVPIELLPDTNLPQLSVEADWRGASPETVEAFLTSPLEAAAQRVRGVERVTSVSREGRSQVTVEFSRDVDMDFARLDLSERLSRLEDDLPHGISAIQVEQYVPSDFEEEARRPLLTYTFTGPLLLEVLRAHLDEEVAPELGQVRGVARAVAQGGSRRLLEVELDGDQITSVGLSPTRVAQEILGLDLVREAGAVREGDRQLAIAIRDRPASIDDIHNAVFASNGRTFRIGDFARVRDTFEQPVSLHRMNGSPAVTLRIYREHGTNAVDVAERARQRVEELQALNPPGAELILVDDQAEDIRRQLTDLRFRALVSGAVIFLVLLLFLRSLRSAGVVFLTIAFSILIALNLIYFAGFTLNILTLMGLALGFGLIVDNSIVVLENIYRRWQEGDDPEVAAEQGALHVVLPIVASTVTTLIVFVPFVYFQGELQLYYVPLAIVVALTLLASLFVAFTFIPALAARILGGGGELAPRSPAALELAGVGERPASGVGSGSGPRSPFYIRFYAGLLDLTLKAPWAAVLVAALCLGGSWHLFDSYVTRGTVWGGGMWERSWIDIQITLPQGSDLERVDELSQSFEARLAGIDEIGMFETQVFGTRAQTQVFFPDSLEHTPVPLIIEERLKSYSLGYTGAQVRVYGQGPSFYGGGGGVAPNYRINVLGYNYERVRDIAEDLGTRLQGVSRVGEIDTNATGRFSRERATEYAVEVDRDALARYDLTVQELIWEMQAALQGAGGAGRVSLGGEPVAFEVKLAGFLERDVRGLEQIMITSPVGTAVRLGDLVRVAPREVLAEVRREDQQYHRTVAYEFRGPRRLGDVYHDAAIASTDVPPGYTVRGQDPFTWGTEDQRQMWLVLLVSVGLVFMVTSGLFESLRQPFCVLLAVPMALTGVFLIFFYVNASFTREAFIGVIMMGGIVVNNAILLVDHINRVRQERGDLSLERAIVQGTLERVRPILMTTVTTVLGLLPLVMFMPTADATIWNALTYALIGGLLSSTLFVLTTTPALYLLFERGLVGQRILPASVRNGLESDAREGGGWPEDAERV